MRSPWNEPPRGRAGPTRRRPQGGTAGDARSCKLPNSSPAPSPHPPVSGYKQELPVRANKRTASTSPQHQRAACDAQTGAALHLPDAQALWEQDAVGEAASGPRPQKAAPKSTVAGQDKAERQDRPKETQQRPGSPKPEGSGGGREPATQIRRRERQPRSSPTDEFPGSTKGNKFPRRMHV